MNLCNNLSRHLTCRNHLIVSWCFHRNITQQTEEEKHTENDTQKPSKNDAYPFELFDNNLKEYLETKNQKLHFPSRSSSLVHYISDSKVLQFLAQLNMKLYLVEKRNKECLNFMVRLRLKEDVGSKLNFLKSIGISPHDMGNILTKNPHILNPEYTIPLLQENLNYFKMKKFSDESIETMVVRFPKILTMPIVLIDGMLGFYQNIPTKHGTRKPIYLSADELRSIITSTPRLLGGKTDDVYDNIRMLEMSCGFSRSQIKRIILGCPNILLKTSKQLEILYKFYTREMKLPLMTMVLFPQALNTRTKILIPRHLYLCHLKRNIYDHEQPGYLPITSIMQRDNQAFCDVCKLGPLENYLRFLKTT